MPANKWFFQTPKGQKALWRHTDLPFSGFCISLGLFLQERCTSEQLHLWVPNWIKHKSSVETCATSTEFSNTEHSPEWLRSCLGKVWFISPSTGMPTPKPGSLCIPKINRQARPHPYGPEATCISPLIAKGPAQTDSYTGNNHQQKSCSLPGDLLSHTWAKWDIGIFHSYSKQCDWEAYRQNFRWRQLLTRNKHLPIFLPKAHYRVVTRRANRTSQDRTFPASPEAKLCMWLLHDSLPLLYHIF